MRNTILRCLVLALAVSLPSVAHAANTNDRIERNEPRPKKAEANQPRRRAVRKTAPAGPSAANDTYSIPRGSTLTVLAPGVLSNDSDPLSKPLSAILVTTTIHGTLTLNADGSFSYLNDGSGATSDAFTYKANNGSTDTTAATATINITDPPPQAAADSYQVNQGAQLDVPAPGVLTNDNPNNATISSYGASAGTEQATIGANTTTASGGTVALAANGAVTYNPAGGFSGSDSFKYVLSNATGTSTATVSINVQPSNEVDFTVTSPGFFYVFTGVAGQNPPLTLTRGRTYRFRINTAAAHPFEILDAPPGSVTNNNISNGILTFAVPAGQGVYQYHCSLHDFGNDINTTP
jgi:hypothetical protein